MDIRKVLRTENIQLNLQAASKEEAIQKIAVSLLANHEIEDVGEFIGGVLEREALGFTGAGNWVAIPHGISSQLKKIVIAMARVPQAVYWDTLQENIHEEAKQVRFIILFAIPKEAGEELDVRYIKVLQQICSRLLDKEQIDFLLEAESNEKIIEFFNEKKENKE